MSKKLSWAIVVLFVITAALAAGNWFATGIQVAHLGRVVARQAAEASAQAAIIAQLRRQQLAACGSAGDLGSIPIPAKPRPSKLAISLVTDNRNQWRQLHCPGSLPSAASLGLDKWARYYHLPSS